MSSIHADNFDATISDSLSTDLNPHADTPVEILHVILLGFVKYFWRDAVARIPVEQRPILMARLSSLETAGLNIPPLAGYTLVKYAGSLTGRDFRAIAQTAPFVLHNLGLPDEHLLAWTALSSLVSLVWQPEIHNVDTYLVCPDAPHHTGVLTLLCRKNLRPAFSTSWIVLAV